MDEKRKKAMLANIVEAETGKADEGGDISGALVVVTLALSKGATMVEGGAMTGLAEATDVVITVKPSKQTQKEELEE